MDHTQTVDRLLHGFKPQQEWLKNTGKKALIFFHIPKCAGTSFTASLQEHFPKHLMVHNLHHWLNLHQAMGNGDLAIYQTLSIAGHASWGVHEILKDFDCYYITFLRNPIDRILSHYRQEQKWHFDKQDLRNFVLPRIKYSGLIEALGHHSPELAKYRLTDSLDSFGLVEEYQRSLQWFESRYDLHLKSSQLNRTKGSENEDSAREEVRRMYEKENPAELEFYEFAVELFHQRTKELPTTTSIQSSGTVQTDSAKEKPSKIQFFDPFKEMKNKIEKLIADNRINEAIELLESVDQQSYFGPDRLTDLYLRKGDLRNATRWAAEKRREFLHDFLRFWQLKTAAQPQNYTLKLKLLLDKIAEFRHIPSNCPDSSLNRSLHTLCLHVINTIQEAVADDLNHRSLLSTKLQETIDRYTDSCPEFWERITSYINEHAKQASQ
jgi:hypothetical protein